MMRPLQLLLVLKPFESFFAYVVHKDFKVFQMNVKTTFFNGELDSEVYLQYPPGFVNLSYPNYCYKLPNVVCGLKKAPHARFRKSNGKHLIFVKIYVYHINFGTTGWKMVADFAKQTVSRF